jgi:hypothetical protein
MIEIAFEIANPHDPWQMGIVLATPPGDACHVEAILPLGYGKDACISSREPYGVSIQAVDTSDPKRWRRYKLPGEWTPALLARIEHGCGLPYDFLGAALSAEGMTDKRGPIKRLCRMAQWLLNCVGLHRAAVRWARWTGLGRFCSDYVNGIVADAGGPALPVIPPPNPNQQERHICEALGLPLPAAASTKGIDTEHACWRLWQIASAKHRIHNGKAAAWREPSSSSPCCSSRPQPGLPSRPSMSSNPARSRPTRPC